MWSQVIWAAVPIALCIAAIFSLTVWFEPASRRTPRDSAVSQSLRRVTSLCLLVAATLTFSGEALLYGGKYPTTPDVQAHRIYPHHMIKRGIVYLTREEASVIKVLEVTGLCGFVVFLGLGVLVKRQLNRYDKQKHIRPQPGR